MARKGSLSRSNRDVQTLTSDNRVFLYIRASTPEQVNSLDAQAASARRFALNRELIIDGTETDAGVSAIKHGFRDRPGAQRMFRTMKQRGIRTVLVLRVDRAFRSSLDFAQTLQWCREEGFSFRFIDPDIDLGTPMGEMFIQIQVALAQMEGKIRTARVDDALDSLRDRRLSRNGNAASYGWKALPCTDGTTTRGGKPQFYHVAVPAEQAVLIHLQELWEMNPGHGSLTRLACRMNELGIPTKNAGQIMKRGGVDVVCSGRWEPATVKSVLEHAIPATAADLPDGLPTLQAAIAILRRDTGIPACSPSSLPQPASI